jgi:hypothetical protein
MADKPSCHYLPGLTGLGPLAQSAPSVPAPDASGQWIEAQRTHVSEIAQALRPAGNASEDRVEPSLPDVWARPLLFHSALKKDSGHPLRGDLLREWRGLLSVIALSEKYGVDLQLQPVSIKEGVLADALTELLPAAVQLEKSVSYDWKDVLLFRVKGRTIGALSPLTLVYTGVRNLRAEDLPQFVENGRLRPPTGADDLLDVAHWVNRLINEFTNLLWIDNKKNARGAGDGLNTLLQEWLGDAKEALGDREGPLPPAKHELKPSRTLESTWPALQKYRVYAEILRPFHFDRPEHSDLFLQHRRSPERKVVVITQDQLLVRKVTLWGSDTSESLGMLQDSKAMLRHFPAERYEGDTINSHKMEGATWIRPERYFVTDTLFVSPTDGPLTAGPENVFQDENLRRFVLPFRRTVLDFFTPEEINTELKPRIDPIEGGFRFTFTLRIVSMYNSQIQGDPREVNVQRDFRYKDAKAGEGVAISHTPEPVYMFPRYQASYWRRYFLFEAGKAKRVEPIFSPDSPTKPVQVLRTRPDCSIHQFTGDFAFPEALEISTVGSKPAGIVLLKAQGRPPKNLGDKPMQLGVDFGTSNTNVFLKVGDNNPRSWIIDFTKSLQPVFSGNANPILVANNFLQPERFACPIATHLRIHGTEGRYPLLDYFIDFQRANEYDLREGVHADIKWTDITKTGQFIKSLLTLLLIEVVDEGASSFKIIYSFPKAFSQEQRNNYTAVWNDSAIPMLTGCGLDPRGGWTKREDGAFADRIIDLSDGSNDNLKPMFSGSASVAEAISAGEYFASRDENGIPTNITIGNQKDRADVAQTAVCVDVGGGTSDISIWHANQCPFDASVLLAGRQIASWLHADRNLRDLLFSSKAAVALSKATSERDFAACLNSILRNPEEEAVIKDKLLTHAMTSAVQKFRRLLAIEFGAITFYTATVVGGVSGLPESHSATCAPGCSLESQIERNGLKIHWGGTASKMLQWIGRLDNDGTLGFLGAILFNALGDAFSKELDVDLGNPQSPRYKDEVAGGLIVWNNFRRKQSAAQTKYKTVPKEGSAAGAVGDGPDRIFLGEAIVTDSGRIEHNQSVLAADLFPRAGGTILREVTLERLARFVDIVNFVGTDSGILNAGNRLELTKDLRRQIAGQVREQWLNLALKPDQERSIEPVFISEVKALLEALSHDR